MPLIFTDSYLQALAQVESSELGAVPPVVSEVAFGLGQAALEPSRTALVEEGYRVPAQSITREGHSTVVARFDTQDAMDMAYFSELGIFDTEGRMLVYGSFEPIPLITGQGLTLRLVLH